MLRHSLQKLPSSPVADLERQLVVNIWLYRVLQSVWGVCVCASPMTKRQVTTAKARISFIFLTILYGRISLHNYANKPSSCYIKINVHILTCMNTLSSPPLKFMVPCMLACKTAVFNFDTKFLNQQQQLAIAI